MGKIQNNQNGFSLVEGLLIFVIVAIIGGTGWYVYSANKKANSTYNAAVKSSQSTASAKTLSIPGLGIKFKLTSKLKNAYYGKVGNFFYLSVHDFDTNPELVGCSVNADKGYLGILGITTGKVGVGGDNGTPDGGIWTQAQLDASGMTKVGDTYYGFQSGNAPCFDPTKPDAQQNAQVVSDFKKAFSDQLPTITKI